MCGCPHTWSSALWNCGAAGDLPMPVVATAAAVLVFGFRILAMLRHWTAPRAWERDGRDDG